MWRFTITGIRLQSLTYTQHSWLLSTEDSLMCHTNKPFIMVISEDPRTRDTHSCCRLFGSGAVNTCFKDLGVFPHPELNPDLLHVRQMLYQYATASVKMCVLVHTIYKNSYMYLHACMNFDQICIRL